MKSLFFSLYVLISGFTFCQTDNTVRYLNIENASASPDSIAYLFLDCNTDDCETIFSNFNIYKNIKGIYISNYDGKLEKRNFGIFRQLESITIEKSPNINLNKLFNDLEQNENLNTLSLKDNNLIKLPSSIKQLANLKSINISNNPNIKLEKTIELLADLKSLEEIYLPINSITNLPNNISELTHLKILDISNNYLEDLPEGIKDLRNLEELSIEGNLIQNSASSLENIKNLNLKYIALDDGLTEEDEKKLKKLFPNAMIKAFDSSDSIDEEIEKSLTGNKDTVAVANNTANGNQMATESSPKKNKKITYGDIKVSQNDIKIYSQAYLHYPEIFKLRRFSAFDSTMFEERFTDTTYANVTKIQYADRRGNRIPLGRNYEKFKLEGNNNGVKNENWFRFRGHTQSVLTKNNPELNAFIGMSWVLVDNLSSKEFKNKYLRVKGYKWYKLRFWNYWSKWKFWTDVRITYENQNFNIHLKNLDGFTNITAYPRYNSMNRTIDDAQKTYVKRYARYSKSLSRRKKSFERYHQRNKSQFEKNNKNAENKRWKSFQKNYMSQEEKELSREDWLIYYDKLIANERKAMGNASANINNITRSLDLDGYSKAYLWTIADRFNTENRTDTSYIQPIKTLYQDKDSNMLAVKRILIVDKDTKSYQTFEGSLGIKMIRLNLVEGANTVFITQLRNGDTGYIKSNVYQKIKFPKSNKYKFTLNTIDTKFGSVQMIREELVF